MTEEIRNIFIAEASEQLSTIDLLLDGQTIVAEPDTFIEKVFLTMHSIKGSSPMFGFKNLPLMALPVEKTFAKIRRGELQLSPELLFRTHCIVKHLQQALHAKSDLHLVQISEQDDAVNYFKNLCS